MFAVVELATLGTFVYFEGYVFFVGVDEFGIIFVVFKSVFQ